MNLGDDIPSFPSRENDDDDDLQRLIPFSAWPLSPIRLQRDASDPSGEFAADLSTISGSIKLVSPATKGWSKGIGKIDDALRTSSHKEPKGNMLGMEVGGLERGIDPPVSHIDAMSTIQHHKIPFVIESMTDKSRERSDTASTTDAFISPVSKRGSDMEDNGSPWSVRELHDPALVGQTTFTRHRRLNTAESVVRAVRRGSQIAALEEPELQPLEVSSRSSHQQESHRHDKGEDPSMDMSSFSASDDCSNTDVTVLDMDDTKDKPAVCPERQRTVGTYKSRARSQMMQNTTKTKLKHSSPDRPLAIPQRQTTCESIPSLEGETGRRTISSQHIGKRPSLPPLSKQPPTRNDYSPTKQQQAKKKRSSLPPQQPHRRKPSLIIQDEEDVNSAKAGLNSAFPSIFNTMDAAEDPLLTADARHMSCPNLDYREDVIQSWLSMTGSNVATALTNENGLESIKAPVDRKKTSDPACKKMDPNLCEQENSVTLKSHGSAVRPGLNRLVTPPMMIITPAQNSPPMLPRQLKPTLTLSDLPVVTPTHRRPIGSRGNGGFTDIFLPSLIVQDLSAIDDNELGHGRLSCSSLPDISVPVLMPEVGDGEDGSIEIWLSSSSHSSI